MEAWICRECGYLYDPAEGDPENGVKVGTPFEELAADWICPVCSVPKEMFNLFS